MSTLQQRSTPSSSSSSSGSISISMPTAAAGGGGVRPPSSSGGASGGGGGSKFWERIIMLLVTLLACVLIGAVLMLTSSKHATNNISSSSSSSGSSSSSVSSGANLQKDSSIVVPLEDDNTGNQQNNNNNNRHQEDNHQEAEHHDNNNKEDQHQKQQEEAPGDVEAVISGKTVSTFVDGFLIDAHKMLPVKDASEADNNNVWKVTCVAGRTTSFARMQQPCFMNFELVDRRDADDEHHQQHHAHGNDGKHVDKELLQFTNKIGKGIRRKHRPIPDEALIEKNLFPQKLRFYKHHPDKSGDNIEAGGEDNKQKNNNNNNNNNNKEATFGATPQNHAGFLREQSVHIHGGEADGTGGGDNNDDPADKMFQWVHPSDNRLVVSASTISPAQKGNDETKQTTLFTMTGGEDVKFFGAGNRGSSMQLPNKKPIRLKNLDINHYELDATISLYGTVPLVYVHVDVGSRLAKQDEGVLGLADDYDIWKKTKAGEQSIVFGIFYLNGAVMHLEADDNHHKRTLKFTSDGGGVRYFFLPGPTPMAVLKQYYELTGTPQLPPLFSLGYHQSRWSYMSQNAILTLHKKFKSRKLPCDVLWLDIDHTNDKRYFTWDPNRFPNPAEMQDKIFREAKRRLVAINDPHIKHDDNYHVFSQANSGNHFVTHNDGRTFYGHCWPGESAWIDFLQPETRKWYATLFRYSSYQGSTPNTWVWQDMNEPSVFSGPDLTLPFRDAAHFGGAIAHRDVHNTYGFFQTMAGYQGLHDRDLYDVSKPLLTPRRPFILTRSFFAGSHRYAAVWTGDNQGRWDHLSRSFDMVLLLGMSGIHQVGADIGGFFDSSPENLISAWYSAAVAYPFMRSHAHQDTRRREPWEIESSAEYEKIRRAMLLRYRLVSYLYTCFARLHIYGEALLRPLWFVFPHQVFSFLFKGSDHHKANSAEFVFWGNALMFRPIVSEAETISKDINLCQNDNDKIFLVEEQSSTGGGDQKEAVQKIPNFVSLCTLQWISPDLGESCKLDATTCETPLFQRSQTVMVLNAINPSLKFDSSSLPLSSSSASASSNSGEDTASSIQYQFPDSTADLQSPSSPLEVRIAFSLDNLNIPSNGGGGGGEDKEGFRDGDILAYGSHFIDDGESEFTTINPTAPSCLISWVLHVFRSNELSLCATPVPEQRDVMPPFHPPMCAAEMQRIRRFVFHIHASKFEKSPFSKLKMGKLQHRHHHRSSAGAEKEQDDPHKIISLIKSENGPESYTWVLPWGNRGDSFERISPGQQWCIEIK